MDQKDKGGSSPLTVCTHSDLRLKLKTLLAISAFFFFFFFSGIAACLKSASRATEQKVTGPRGERTGTRLCRACTGLRQQA